MTNDIRNSDEAVKELYINYLLQAVKDIKDFERDAKRMEEARKKNPDKVHFDMKPRIIKGVNDFVQTTIMREVMKYTEAIDTLLQGYEQLDGMIFPRSSIREFFRNYSSPTLNKWEQEETVRKAALGRDKKVILEKMEGHPLPPDILCHLRQLEEEIRLADEHIRRFTAWRYLLTDPWVN